VAEAAAKLSALEEEAKEKLEKAKEENESLQSELETLNTSVKDHKIQIKVRTV
tara:strand:- start:122 stop:280 length:159 start_codon:yes stop_codon:yes gene_type:complete